jgi:periplasmic divalent cation tolerance protein
VAKLVDGCNRSSVGTAKVTRNAEVMSELWQVSTTTGTREVAERIAVELVDRRLAACAQVSGPIVSTYRWEGKIENAEEWLCTAKTSRQHLAAIQEVLTRLHPYELPELVAVPIVAGSEAYLKWAAEQLGSGRGTESG